MTFQVSDVVDQARVLLNDTRSSAFRYSDAQMLLFFSNAINRTFTLRPDLFSTVITLSTPSTLDVANYEQLLNGQQNFLKVISVETGGSGKITPEEVRWEDFANSKKSWASDFSGLPTKFVRDKYSSSRFYLNPPPGADTVLEVQVAEKPALVHTLSTTLQRPSPEYVPALTDCVVFLAQSIDDEHITSQRAQLFYESFISALGVGEQILRRNSLSPISGSQEMRNDPQ